MIGPGANQFGGRPGEHRDPGTHRILADFLKHNEIAAMVGCSIGNSKSQLHKARMKLRKSLKTSRAEKAATKHWGEMKYELCGV